MIGDLVDVFIGTAQERPFELSGDRLLLTPRWMRDGRGEGHTHFRAGKKAEKLTNNAGKVNDSEKIGITVLGIKEL